MPSDWTSDEVSALVADYFSMLAKELDGAFYSKTDHRRNLSKRLLQRTDGSIERKHQNLSAILIEFGLPYVDGYKPLAHYQLLLHQTAEDYLYEHPEALDAVSQDVESSIDIPAVEDVLSRLEPPPSTSSAGIQMAKERAQYGFAARKINFLEVEARNRHTGAAGEVFVVRFEQARLERAGRDKLAAQVEQISRTQGDGAGFDVLSFDEQGRELFIEVKATRYGRYTPFFVTNNELRFSRMNSADYQLARVFDLRRKPRLFVVGGALDRNCLLEPDRYLARF